jgi:hypothetical protein
MERRTGEWVAGLQTGELMRRFSFKLTASLLVLASAVVPAVASDAKNYPGAACLASGSAITRIERPSTGRANNLGPGATVFQCPAVKDFADVAGAVIHVIDESTTDQVVCTLRSRSLAGTFDVDDAVSGIAFHDSDPKPLTITALDADNPYGYYILTCEVPAPFVDANGVSFRSGIVTYQITEND